ncbi:hypothetical protein H8F18_06920 [Vibrio fluvialis]|uniref:hypothetical protein n=1 Tax=Vibrio fluvialis TaxID=676 RepID=UPI00192B6C9C|nr:hypothetical protein [Vibrio fluvialis]ELV8681520.1 hypothetical protein [Vibrio fluvialis]MBL4242213.1 hypothetical protein [Vibrio fluvialis]MBL4254260.1 hypothetical protein [Vibrio fluvialis]
MQAARWSGVSSCPTGMELNDAGKCVVPSCEDRKAKNAPGVGTVPNDGKAITATRYYCDSSTMCEAIQTYTANDGNLLKNNYYTGNNCVGSPEDYADDPWYGQKENDPLPNGCTPHPYLEDGGYFCNKDNDGDGKPDLDADIDNDAVCDYDSDGHFSCSGGSYDKPFEVTDPTTPIDDTPDFEGGTGSNPNPIDSATSPNVDDSPAPEGSDQGVIAAVRNLNSNLTQAITTQTNKNVQGFNTVNEQLAQLKQTNTQLGQKIVDQMRQDKQIYENTKALIQNSTTGIVSNINSSANRIKDAVKDAEDGIVAATKEGADSVKGAVEAGTEQLDGSISGLGDKLDGLLEAVSGAASSICNPNTDSRSCEGNHGLTQPQVADMFNQMKEEMDAQVSAGESNLKNTMQQLVDNPKMTEGHDLIQSLTDDLIGVLPNSNACVDMPLQTPLGTFSLGCEFSERIKAILAFMFYVYTLYSLVEILFTGFTPVAGTVPYMSRR